MKKLLCVLMLILGWLVSFGQRQPILPYGNHSIAEIKTFSESGSEKSNQWKSIILGMTQEESMEAVLKKVSIVDTILKAGVYQNSCWNTQTKKIEFFLGKQFKGKVALYKGNDSEIILYKDTCANILKVSAKKFNISLSDNDEPYDAPAPAPKPEPKPVSKKEKDITYVVVEHINRNVEQPRHQVYQDPGYRSYSGRLSLNVRIGRPYGYGYQQRPQVIHNNIDNNNYYYQNYSCFQPEKPQSRPMGRGRELIPEPQLEYRPMGGYRSNGYNPGNQGGGRPY